MLLSIEKLIAMLEDKIQESESAVDDPTQKTTANYHEGYAAGCHWILEMLEESYMRSEIDTASDDDGSEW